MAAVIDPAFTWGDATVRTLESQMRLPLFNEHPVEMGLKGNERFAVDTLSGDAVYRDLFNAAFPGDPVAISVDHLIKAIAAFERSLTAAAYTSQIPFIDRFRPEYVVTGHTHRRLDFRRDGVRFISNPRGYPGEGVRWPLQPRTICRLCAAIGRRATSNFAAD